MSEPTAEAVLNEFLKSLAEDRAAGLSLGLEHYLSRFPGHAEVVAREFIALNDESVTGIEAVDIIGNYELGREVGRGGQGVVYAAQDLALHRRVALKVLQAGAGLSGAALERFRREAEVTARLEHPNICTVYETGTHGGRAFIAMRFVEGEPLDRRTRRLGVPGRADVMQCVSLVATVARALHSAHEAGVIHRDVKPSNIMITADAASGSGRSKGALAPVITDFGLASIDDEALPTLTRTGDILGTPAYMSPEQINRNGVIDRRADVYSLGITLYECLTASRPFSGPTRDAVYRAILEDAPEPPSRRNGEVSRDLDIVVATAIEKSPARRYRTAAEMADDLDRVLAGEPIAARPLGAVVKLARWRRRNPTIAAALLAAVLLTAFALVQVTSSNRRLEFEKRRTQEALESFERLADVRRLRELRRRADELWPATPDRVESLGVWLDDASTLIARRERHLLDLGRVEKLLARDGGNEESWRHDILSELTTGLDAIAAPGGLIESIASRQEFASTLLARSVDDHVQRWARVNLELEASPVYDGLVVPPQVGLVPLGKDPDSGLQEFLHLATHRGDLPERDRQGRIELGDDCGVILVLLPGGLTTIGSDGESGRNADPRAAKVEGPATDVRLGAFFISKYEMTQGQWRNFNGATPSWFRIGRRFGGVEFTPRHPVTNVDWNVACREAGRMDLALPTEAQWEYACRAGGGTAYYFGDARRVVEFANLADRRFGEAYPRDPREDNLDDGWITHAPVGSFAANAFGLHDMSGNVYEWCRDGFASYAGAEFGEGDGFRDVEGEDLPRILRGGSFKKPLVWLRCSARGFNDPTIATSETGVRPVRTLRP